MDEQKLQAIENIARDMRSWTNLNPKDVLALVDAVRQLRSQIPPDSLVQRCKSCWDSLMHAAPELFVQRALEYANASEALLQFLLPVDHSAVCRVRGRHEWYLDSEGGHVCRQCGAKHIPYEKEK